MICRKKIFIFGSFLFLIGFVLAAANAPTALVLNNNATSSYDEGSFFVNWTSGGGDAAANYTIYIFSNNTLYNSTINNSVTGYSFSNTTEANYTFIIEAVNATGSAINSTSNISIYIDSTAPVITLPNYTNATLKKNTDNLTLNISISDALSGLTGSVCLIDVNGTNQSVAVSSGWCNSSSIALTGLADGNQTINVYVNDTINNLGLNNSYVVQIDTTAPSPSALTLSSSTTTSLTITFSGAEGTCTASGSGTKSISGSTLSVTSLSCGTSYAYTITCVDSASNSGASSSTSFTTTGCGGGSANVEPSFWSLTFITNEDQFIEGFTKELSEGERFNIEIDNEDHYVGVIDLTSTTVKINVSSDPQQEVFNIGNSKKFEVTGDGFYDILVTLNSIDSDKANITILSIYEEVLVEADVFGNVSSEGEENIDVEIDDVKSFVWLWILIGLIVLGVGAYFFWDRIKDLFSS